jgi:hypothetical protein
MIGAIKNRVTVKALEVSRSLRYQPQQIPGFFPGIDPFDYFDSLTGVYACAENKQILHNLNPLYFLNKFHDFSV